MFNSKVNSEQRKKIRIPSGRIVKVTKEIEGEKLNKIIEATVVDYSLEGCCLIIMTEYSPKLKELYNLDLTRVESKLGVKKAKVMWYQELGDNVFRIGLMYID